MKNYGNFRDGCLTKPKMVMQYYVVLMHEG